MKILHRRNNHQGDTLIEVLIGIAIAALVLTSSYLLASRSLKQGITAREHTEALYLAQGQIEMLKYREQKSPNLTTFAPFQTTENFCLIPGITYDSLDPDWQPQSNPNPSQLNSAGYDDKCIDGTGRYYMNISRGPLTTSPPTYLVTVKWESINRGIDQSQIYYRF